MTDARTSEERVYRPSNLCFYCKEGPQDHKGPNMECPNVNRESVSDAIPSKDVVQIVYSELMAITAEMARGDGLPSDIGHDHAQRRSRDYWLNQNSKGLETAKLWALRIRDAINKLPRDTVEIERLRRRLAEVEPDMLAWRKRALDAEQRAVETSEYCTCGKGTVEQRPGHAPRCGTCGKDLHPDNFE